MNTHSVVTSLSFVIKCWHNKQLVMTREQRFCLLTFQIKQQVHVHQLLGIYLEPDPPENCQLNVKKLPTT